MSFWARLFNRKQSMARTALAFNQVGQPVQTPRNYEAFSKEGYQVNVIGFKCVSIISRAAASVKWGVYSKARIGMEPVELNTHPLLDLINKPNPLQGKAAFFESVFAYYLISGNSYIESVAPGDRSPPLELWPLRPDRIRIIPGPIGLPAAYEFKGSQKTVLFPVDQISGNSALLHMKTFHPTDPWYGMSPIESAVYSIDQHNEAGKWNTSLLQNHATPSGVVSVKQDAANPMGVLPDVQFNNFKEEIKRKMSGADNAGRVLFLEGGMDWKAMGFSPKDMDWLEGRKMASRDIALAFGVPPIILNIPGDSTFANYKEARLSLYEDTIIPLMDNIQDELNKWLSPKFGDNIELRYDVDSIPALEQKRTEKFTLISSAGFLSINEKRLAVGYDAVESGDIILVASGLVDLNTFGDVPETEEVPGVIEDSAPESEEDQAPNGDSTDDGQNEIDDVEENLGKHLNQFSGYKQVNPLSKRDRQRIVKKLNLERDKLSDALYHDLKEEFDSMADAIGNVVEGLEPKTAEFAVLKTISSYSAKLSVILSKHYKRSLIAFGENILQSGKAYSPVEETKTRAKFLDAVNRITALHVAESISAIEGTNIKRARVKIKNIIADGVADGESLPDLKETLKTEFALLSDSRARVIANTEIGTASNLGSLEAAKSLEIPGLKKEWVPVIDDRTRDGSNGDADHVAMEGVSVNIDEKFTVPPDASMEGPGDPAGGASQICSCRCVLTYGRG